MASAQFLIRRFRLSQLPKLLEIEREAFRRDAYTTAMFRELHKDCGELFFVARHGRHLAGYMVTCAAPPVAEVVSIATLERYRRQGVARLLMQHTLSELRARRVRRVELMVRQDNSAALRFYRKLGFRAVGKARRYYEDGTTAVRMRKHVA